MASTMLISFLPILSLSLQQPEMISFSDVFKRARHRLLSSSTCCSKSFCCFFSSRGIQFLNPIWATIKSELKMWAFIQYGSVININFWIASTSSLHRSQIHKANLLKLKSHKMIFFFLKVFYMVAGQQKKKLQKICR